LGFVVVMSGCVLPLVLLLRHLFQLLWVIKSCLASLRVSLPCRSSQPTSLPLPNLLLFCVCFLRHLCLHVPMLALSAQRTPPIPTPMSLYALLCCNNPATTTTLFPDPLLRLSLFVRKDPFSLFVRAPAAAAPPPLFLNCRSVILSTLSGRCRRSPSHLGFQMVISPWR
jgi:hypothetical protein